MKWYIIIILITTYNFAIAQQLNYDVKDVNNNWVNFEELTGEKYTVIDFWATWCKPCVNALPKINDLNEKYSNESIKFIGINVDGPRNQAKVKPFTRSLNIGYSIVLDPDQEILNDMNVSVLPTLIILDAQNKEVYRHEGFHQGDEKEFENKLQGLLDR